VGNKTGVNANSAGLAAEALRAVGTDAANAAADRAVAFLLGLQVGCEGAAADRGGIAVGPRDPADPDNTGFRPDTAPRATTQALLGLAGVPLGTLKLGDAKNGASTLDCPTATAPATTIPGAAGILPVTGSSVRPVVFGGAGLVVVGAALVLLARRRRSATGN
jgi:LPXTG-motif cell wall-anchored protein